MIDNSRTIAVITGANRGLGREVARQLTARGVHVVMTARDSLQGRAAAELMKFQGGDVEFHPLDVTDRSSIRKLAGFLEKRYGRLDILINNAGAHPKNDGAGVDVSSETMSEAFAVNCLGAFQVTQELLPLLGKKACGRIINVSTLLASPSRMDQLPGSYFAYRVAKAALNAVTAAMAAELTSQRISVNAVHPGWLQTAMGGPHAPQPVEEGAAAVVHLALEVPATVSGTLFAQQVVSSW